MKEVYLRASGGDSSLRDIYGNVPHSRDEEATGEFLERMKKAGKLKHIEQTMFGGSDFGDDEDDPSESNK